MIIMAIRLLPIVVGLLAIIGRVDCAWGIPETRDFVPLSTASTKFSQKLYKDLAINRPNAVFSPFSAHVALSMAYLGARGNTANELRTALQLTPEIEVHDNYQELIDLLNKVNDVTLDIANSVWIHPDITLLEDYKTELVTKYYANVDALDFSNPNGPEQPINTWVAKQTRDKIRAIVPHGVLSPSTSLIIVNTVYFSADWNSGFNETLTKNKTFTKQDGLKVQVEMMTQTGRFEIKESVVAGAGVLRLPYSDERFAMYVLLPRTFSGLPDLEKTIADDDFDNDMLFNDFMEATVAVSLPKFQFTASMDLKNTLKKLGLSSAFSESANFSGISATKTHISGVMQKAMVEIKESGTVAAAVTEVDVSNRSTFPAVKKTPFTFNADHPFVYFIRQDSSGQILFHGKLSDPQMEKMEAS
ncbi:unnamed protein product [Lymnaea stagnalis]|uniref:Serpin domain-containing protein n=1 Tax=Lymnaea stagnalis TaxID=6523 RepID=A0AAV2HWY5_LYMST